MEGFCVLNQWWERQQGFPVEQGVLTCGRAHLLLSEAHSCYRPREDWRKRQSVWGCTEDANLSSLNLITVTEKKKKRIFLNWLLCLGTGSPKEQAESTNFSVSKEEDICWCAVRKPSNKKGKKASTKAQDSAPCSSTCPSTRRQRIALKKQHTKKNKKEAAEYAELLAQGMKEAKEKCQKQIAKSFSESLYFSKAESSQK